MVPNFFHSDTGDTSKGFDQDVEQQEDQILPYRGVTVGSLTGVSGSTMTGKVDSGFRHLHTDGRTGGQDSDGFPLTDTEDTMVPNFFHSDTGDTSKGFDQDVEQQEDQILPYRGVT